MDTPRLSGCSAQLYVGNVEAACLFYVERLGFTVDFTYGAPPYYGRVSRDAARLALRLVCEPVFAGDIRARETLLAAAVEVATTGEIERLFRDFDAAGVPFHQRLSIEPWGARDFIIADPDGNLVLFAGPAAR